MKLIRNIFYKSIATSTLFIISASVFAGSGTMVVGPVDPSAIPTLSTSMLIVLSLLLMIVAFRIKKKESGNFFIALIGASVLMMSSGGMKLISDLQAGLGQGDITNAAGQTLPILSDQPNFFFNNTDVIQRIISINLPSSCESFPSDGESLPQDCSVGLNLLTEGKAERACIIDCSTLSEVDTVSGTDL